MLNKNEILKEYEVKYLKNAHIPKRKKELGNIYETLTKVLSPESSADFQHNIGLRMDTDRG